MTAPGVVQRGVAARLEDSAPSWASSGHETALRARRRGLLDGVSAGRCAAGETRRGSKGSACGFFAGCMLARGRSAPRRLPRATGAHPRKHGSVLATARCRSSDGVLYAGRFQIFTPLGVPPLGRLTFFRGCRKRFWLQVLRSERPSSHQTAALVLSCRDLPRLSLFALREDDWMKS